MEEMRQARIELFRRKLRQMGRDELCLQVDILSKRIDDMILLCEIVKAELRRRTAR